MCGRYDCHSPIELIAETFRVNKLDADYKPSYNIAPSRNVLIINSDGIRQILNCRWGLVPHWAKDLSEGNRMINARAETVSSKPSFRSSFMKRRCLVVADGFYEWKKSGSTKIPVYVRTKSGRPFGMAGLFSPFTTDKGETVCTCAIITTDSNDLLMEIHERMPVIVPPENEDFWLDPHNADLQALRAMLKPYPSEEMEFYEVSPSVNSPAFDSPSNILAA